MFGVLSPGGFFIRSHLYFIVSALILLSDLQKVSLIFDSIRMQTPMEKSWLFSTKLSTNQLAIT